MLAGRIARWDLAFPIESNSPRLSQNKRLAFSSLAGVTAKPILGGLHHEYGWAQAA
jgi:hypothetical protein